MINQIDMAIPLLGGRGWLGGVSYIELLVRALVSMSPQNRPRLTGVVFEHNLDDFDLYSSYIHCFDRLIFWGSDIGRAQQFLGPTYCLTTFNELFKLVDFYFPVGADIIPGQCAASWIADFQHIHLPENYSDEILKYRDLKFREIADKAQMIILSSNDVKMDFQRLYPWTRAKIRIQRFHSLPRQEWYKDDPESVKQKYALPDRFLICCNQFWKHKNHLLLFNTIRMLRDKGNPVHLICTGSTTDNKDTTEYFKEVRSYLAKHGLESLVRILGIIPRNDQIQLIRLSLAVVQPSLFEGWSTVVEDSRVLGKPIFLSDLAVNMEQNPPFAVFYQRNSAEALFIALSRHLPLLKPGPDHLKEKWAQGTVAPLIRDFALNTCCIALESVITFGRWSRSKPSLKQICAYFPDEMFKSYLKHYVSIYPDCGFTDNTEFH